MPVNCRTCKHYQDSIAVKHSPFEVTRELPCAQCADFKHRKSYYKSITWHGQFVKEADYQKELGDL